MSPTTSKPTAATAEAATILSEALPYIRQFQNAVVVVKLGGNAMDEAELLGRFARDLVLIKLVGMNPVVVHGGGPQIDKALKQLGKTPKFVDGLRVTDAEVMTVVQQVLVGQVNQDIVTQINLHGGQAIGVSGKDGSLLKAKPFKPESGADLGHVGQIVAVNESMLRVVLFANELVPVIAPIGVGTGGESYNINADVAAAAIARQLKAEKLIFLTNTEGVRDGDGQILSRLSSAQAAKLIHNQTILGGMIPKVECALEAVIGGVNSVHIIDGRTPHALLIEMFTETGIGTLITQDG